MPPGVEAQADAALVAIAAGDAVVGTGFVIDDNGTVLTCHHVVDGLTSVWLHGPGGSVREVNEAAIVAAPEIDLALILVPTPFGTPLPLVSDAFATTRYWTKGYHRLSQSIQAPFPVQGNIVGRTSIAYPGATSDYRIGDVFVLRDDSIDPGLSGAPVLDPDTGVVVAVVSTKFIREDWSGGFAVPIGHAAGHAALRAAVEDNQATVPAFGPYLNGPAARTLCAEVTESELDNLAQLRSVDLGRRVPRKAIESAMASFLGNDSPTLALIGQSGVGKSTEMAALARRLPSRALLLRGSSLSREPAGGVGEAIRAAVNALPGKRPLPDDTDELIARALTPDGGLIVLLDALNEAPYNGRDFEEWVADTRSWLRAGTGRLVISCRSELWGDLVGRALAAPFGDRKPTVVSLAGFDDDEYRAALEVYGNATGSDSPVLRLPLVLGLWSHYQADADRPPDAVISLNQAIEAYVGEAARSLAARGAGAPLSAHVMQSRLVAIAELMWNRDSDTVDLASLSHVVSGVDDLVAEGVMAATPSGYRFVYDDVGDWLQARTLDLDRELAAIGTFGENAGGENLWRRIGPIASALRDVELTQGHNALRDRLIRLLRQSRSNESPAFRVAEDTLIKLSDARPYGEVLGLMVEMTTLAPGDLDLIAFLRSVALPLPQRLNLLRELCPLDDYYPWRPKDWISHGRLPSIAHIHSYPELAFYLVSQDPAAGLPELARWLTDRTPLVGGEARVAHVAMGVLYYLRSADERLVRQIMIDDPARCEDLFQRLAMDDPSFLARMIIAEPDAESTDRQVLFAARLIMEKPRLPEDVARAMYAAIAARYERGMAAGNRAAALNVLIRGPDGASYLDPLIGAYQAGTPDVDEWTLTAAARHDPDRIARILAATLGRADRHRETALAALGYASEARVHEIADHAVRLHLEQNGEPDYPICGYVETRLWQGHTASSDLLAVIRMIIAAPAAPGREIVMYPLLSGNGLHDPAQRLSLMREFVAAADGPGSIASVIKELAKTPGRGKPGIAPGDLLELLRLVLGRVDPATADNYLLNNAYFNDGEFGGLLSGWLTTGKLAPPGEYTSQILALVRSGEDPQDAIAQAWRARRAASARKQR